MNYTSEDLISKSKEALFIHDIKTSTARLHLRLESQVLLTALMSPAVTRQQYYFYLALMKEIEVTYENTVKTRLAGIIKGAEHRKSSLLISDDLYNIRDNVEQGFTMKPFTIPGDIISIPFALGFMYVMEGSKLGGKVIYKHIHRVLGYSESYGAKFISDYGVDTFHLWKEFLSTFSLYVTQHNCKQEVIQGAEFAFGSIYDFLESNRLVYEN